MKTYIELKQLDPETKNKIVFVLKAVSKDKARETLQLVEVATADKIIKLTSCDGFRIHHTEFECEQLGLTDGLYQMEIKGGLLSIERSGLNNYPKWQEIVPKAVTTGGWIPIDFIGLNPHFLADLVPALPDVQPVARFYFTHAKNPVFVCFGKDQPEIATTYAVIMPRAVE